MNEMTGTAPTQESKCPTCHGNTAERCTTYGYSCRCQSYVPYKRCKIHDDLCTGRELCRDPWHESKQEWCVTTAKRAFVNARAGQLDAEIVSESKPTSEGARDDLSAIVAKCEQYWNEPNICDAEVHAVLEFIHEKARNVRSQLAAGEKERALLLDADKVPLIWKIREAYKTAHQYHIRHGEISSIDGCKHDLCHAISRAWSEAAKVLLAKGVDLDVIDETAITIPALKAEIQRLRERITELEGSK